MGLLKANISDLVREGSVKSLNEAKIAEALGGISAEDVLDIIYGKSNNDTKDRLNNYALNNGINFTVFNSLGDPLGIYGGEQPQPPAPKPPCSQSLFLPLLFTNTIQQDSSSAKNQNTQKPRLLTRTIYLNGENVSLASLVLSTRDNVTLGTIVADNYFPTKMTR